MNDEEFKNLAQARQMAKMQYDMLSATNTYGRDPADQAILSAQYNEACSHFWNLDQQLKRAAEDRVSKLSIAVPSRS